MTTKMMKAASLALLLGLSGCGAMVPPAEQCNVQLTHSKDLALRVSNEVFLENASSEGVLSPDFTARAEQDGHQVTTLSLDDLYHGLTPAVVPGALRWPDAG
jgi:hypothetical protein